VTNLNRYTKAQLIEHTRETSHRAAQAEEQLQTVAAVAVVLLILWGAF
jgi:hypothetical protein